MKSFLPLPFSLNPLLDSQDLEFVAASEPDSPLPENKKLILIK